MLNLVTTHDPKQAIQFINHSDRDTLIQHRQPLLLWSQRCSFRVGMGHKRIPSGFNIRAITVWSGIERVVFSMLPTEQERKQSQRPHASQLWAMLRVMSLAYPGVIPRTVLDFDPYQADIQRCHSHSWLEIRPNIMQYDWNKAWTDEQGQLCPEWMRTKGQRRHECFYSPRHNAKIHFHSPHCIYIINATFPIVYFSFA